jgi:hypothetical protein
LKLTDVSEVSQHKFTWTADSYITSYTFAHGLVIALMIAAVIISETSINFNVFTLRYIPEDFKLETEVYLKM